MIKTFSPVGSERLLNVLADQLWLLNAYDSNNLLKCHLSKNSLSPLITTQ